MKQLCSLQMADTSFYLTNFPNEFQEMDLWKLFQCWGRVLDVIVFRKLNARKQRIGFVRFHGVRDAITLERQLDSIWIGTWKLQTNIPKYRRQEKPNHTLQRKETSSYSEILESEDSTTLLDSSRHGWKYGQ